jgi:hypothetical protein
MIRLGQANTSATPPIAVIAGPTVLPASCSGTSSGFGVLFDGSQSQRSSSKPLAQYTWGTTATDANLLSDIAMANGRISPQKQAYLVLTATTTSSLAVWTQPSLLAYHFFHLQFSSACRLSKRLVRSLNCVYIYNDNLVPTYSHLRSNFLSARHILKVYAQSMWPVVLLIGRCLKKAQFSSNFCRSSGSLLVYIFCLQTSKRPHVQKGQVHSHVSDLLLIHTIVRALQPRLVEIGGRSVLGSPGWCLCRDAGKYVHNYPAGTGLAKHYRVNNVAVYKASSPGAAD